MHILINILDGLMRNGTDLMASVRAYFVQMKVSETESLIK